MSADKAESLYVRYVKVISFGDPHDAPPIRQRSTTRDKSPLDVVNDSVWFDVVNLAEQDSLSRWEFQSGGVAEGRSLIPWIPPTMDLSQYDPESVFNQELDDDGSVLSAVFHSYNGFGPNKSDIGIKSPIDVGEIRLIVDFTSIGNFGSLLRTPPEVLVQRGQSKEISTAREPAPGLFVATKRSIKRGQTVRIEFDIDWERAKTAAAHHT